MNQLKNLALCSLITCLAACAGGSDGSGEGGNKEPPQQTFKVEGIYDVDYGQFRGTYAFLENGDFYGIHYIFDDTLAGHPRGNLPETNAIDNRSPIAWANFVDDAQKQGNQEPAPTFGRTAFNTTYVDVTIQGSFGIFSTTSSAQKKWFSGSTSTLYFAPIPMSNIAGNYNGIMRSVGIQERIKAVSGLTIDDAGNFTAIVNLCTYTGTLTQHGSTGVFDTFATSSGNECTMAPSLTGLTMPLKYENETPEIAIMLDSSDQNYTAVFIVTQQPN